MAKPFFILGCVRSGTTFLRDVLRRHPNLASPEETHFYRWPEPFGTQAYRKVLLNNKILIRHREIDGISEPIFRKILDRSISRGDLYRRYCHRYIEIKKPGATRWFDKTPQNVYGAAMLTSEFPGSKLVHIVRNPLNVVSSLIIGKIMHVPDIVGACNYWIEAIEIMKVIKRAYPGLVYEIKYEDLTANIDIELPRLLEFLGEEYNVAHFEDVKVEPMHHDHKKIFTQDERDWIEKLCGKLSEPYGYFAQHA